MLARFVSLAGRAAVVLAIAASQSLGQSYPNKPIRIISPHPPGSAPDIVVRAAAQELLPRLGQPMVIEPRPGAGGVIAGESCSKAAPDGYTLCLIQVGIMSFNPHTYSNLPYDPEKDFRPVTRLFFLVQALMASAALPAESFKDLEREAAARPGALNFGTLGPGSQPDVFRQFLADRWKTNIVGVPYKGAINIAQALAAGELQLGVIGIGSAAGALRGGKVRLLAISSLKRYRLFPNIPVFSELGLADAINVPWWGIAVPAGTADAVVGRLNSEFVRLFREPKFNEVLDNNYCEPATGTPEEFAAFLKADREQAGGFVKRYNIPRH